MPHIKDCESFRQHADNDAFAPWSQVPGLRNKIFWLNEEKLTSGGLYTFFTRKALDDYMKTDLFEAMKRLPCGTNLKYEIHENLAGGELCAD
jgi:hypothetical protein